MSGIKGLNRTLRADKSKTAELLDRELLLRLPPALIAFPLVWAVLIFIGVGITPATLPRTVQVLLLAWFLLLSLGRASLILWFERLHHKDWLWPVLFGAGAWLTAASWGIPSGWVLWQHPPVDDMLVLLIALTGLSLGAAVSLAPRPTIALVYLLLIFTPSAAAIAHTLSLPNSVAVEVMLGLLVAFIIIQNFSQYRLFRQQIEDRKARDSARHFYTALAGINALAVARLTLEDLASGSCRLLTEHSHMRLAFIAIANTRGDAIRIVGASGDALDYIKTLSLSRRPDRAGGGGPIVRALQEGRVVRSSSLKPNPELESRLHRSENHGLRDMIALPIASGGKIVAVLAVYSGARDAFTPELVSLLEAATREIGAAISARHQYEAMQQASLTDPLTGLANRERLTRLLQAQIRRREPLNLGLILLDIRNFSDINHALGREHGDRILREISLRLARKTDTVGLLFRSGANAFALLSMDIESPDALVDLAQTLLGTIAEPVSVPDQGDSLHLTASAGLAFASRTTPEAGYTLLEQAEQALHLSREAGGGWRFFAPDLNASAYRRFSIRRELPKALAAGRLGFHFQPVVDLEQERVVGFETLARWTRDNTLHSANQFIDVVEEDPVLSRTLLITSIGAAAKFYSLLRAQGIEADISVNISARELFAPDLIEAITTAWGRPEWEGLSLELLETVGLADIPRAARILTELRACGACIALDDFGTGYASLAYANAMPIESLKLDRSFCINLTRSVFSFATLVATLDYATFEQRSVVAEGIESPAAAIFWRALGGTKIQGNLFSHPLPATEALHYARNFQLSPRIARARRLLVQHRPLLLGPAWANSHLWQTSTVNINGSVYLDWARGPGRAWMQSGAAHDYHTLRNRIAIVRPGELSEAERERLVEAFTQATVELALHIGGD